MSLLPLDDPEFRRDPYPVFAELRARRSLAWDEDLGMWLAFDHRTSNLVLRDRDLGRIWRDREPAVDFGQFNLIHRNALLEMEPPDHTRLRRLVSVAFTRRRTEQLRPRIAELAGALVADMRAAGSADLMPDFAQELPVRVIAELLGIPLADRALLRPWSNAIVKMYEPAASIEQQQGAERAAAEFVSYLREIVAHRRTSPGDDLVSALVRVRDSDGDRLTEDELVTTCILLLNAGHEASVNVIGNGTLALLRHPEQWKALAADPALVPVAVEELIRYDSPLQLFERTATDRVRLPTGVVEKGQKVAALLGSANRDPSVFDAADTLDVRRADNPHLGFGAGTHFCLGAPLARVELQEAFAALLTLPLTLAAPPVHRDEFVIHGLTSVPLSVAA
ncbi:cytochrome P450 [Fodinicola acaciae]|uniref:cytochrome P450 n=1 Tax=Fodinicola acaciae TaxID=2681555 RepID=UPI0013D7738D|nr:cytochrome P450 [Fodinicola acaciae]